MEFIIKIHILSHRNIRDSKQQLLLCLRASVCHEFDRAQWEWLISLLHDVWGLTWRSQRPGPGIL